MLRATPRGMPWNAWQLFAIALLIVAGFESQAKAQPSTVLPVTATVNASIPYITLQWPSPSTSSSPVIWRRLKGGKSWERVATLTSLATSYADMTASLGEIYEYSVQCGSSYGAIVSGSNVPLVQNRGKIILLVDATMIVPLAPELTQLQQDLVADGWSVYRHDVARSTISPSSTQTSDYSVRLAELKAVRTLVQNDYKSAPGSDWALMIVGHVPVPYSGITAPDGHGDHWGAWPTDTYYADIDGLWTDSSVDNSTTTLSDERNRNVPSDGKFDQSQIPSDTEIQCGRIDLWNMPKVPVGMSETELLRQYFQRDHCFRYGLSPYDVVVRRGIVDDNFNGDYSAGDWRTGIDFFGIGAGHMEAADWFGTVQTNSIMFAVGHGGGGFTSCSGVGTSTNDFGQKDSKAVFLISFGSYFGDWDSTNNYLRAPLAGTVNSLGLTNVWSGRGYFHLYHMAMGEVIGYGVRYTQNNDESTSVGGWDSGGYSRAVTYNLMGDPTLRLHTISPPTGLTGFSTSGGVALAWNASPDATAGYHVCRSTSEAGPFTRLTGVTASGGNPTGSPITTTSYVDATAVSGVTYTYIVKTVRMETSASGSYANQSLGEFLTLTYQSAGGTGLTAPSGLVVLGTGLGSYTLFWLDNSTSESSYEIERRNYLNGAWSVIASLNAGATTYLDDAAPVGQITHYRVRAKGPDGSYSLYSRIAADLNLPGIVRTAADHIVINKSDSLANLGVERFNGSLGTVSTSMVISSLFNEALFNGNLEDWKSISGTPPTGQPTYWAVWDSRPIKVPGLGAGSMASAFVTASTASILVQDLISPTSKATIGFQLAATDPGSPSSRSFHLILYSTNSSNAYMSLVVLRTVQGSKAGKLSLQAFNGSWQTIAADAFDASVYVASSNSFTTLKIYNMSIAFDFSTDSYSVSYGLLDSTMTTLKNVNMFQNAPGPTNGEQLTRLYFSGAYSTSGYAIDNVTVTSSNSSSAYSPIAATLNWVHGEKSTKTISVNILNPPSPQLTEILKMIPTSVSDGLIFGSPSSTFLLIKDPTATIPSPWQTTTIGSSVLDPGYGEYANGTFGMTVRSNYNSNTNDSMRFLYRPVSGDFQMTARVAYLDTAMTPDPRAGIMVRSSATIDNAAMASLRVSSDYFEHMTRKSTSGVATTSFSNPTMNPCWLRLTRLSDAFSVYRSTNGTTWTQVDSTETITSMGSPAYVGFALSSNNSNISLPQQLSYVRFDNVTVYTVPATPTGLQAKDGMLPGEIQISWTSAEAATTYKIERSTLTGTSFVPIAETSSSSYLDSSLTPGQIYYYRIKAVNPAFQSGYSTEVYRQPYLPTTIEGWRYQYFGTNSNTGSHAELADPDGDGIPNLMEYALGTNPLSVNAFSSLPHSQIQAVGQGKYLTCTFVRNTTATDLTYSIETSNDLNEPWISIDPLATANQISVQDNSPTTGRQTITVKDTQPVIDSEKRFMRLRISRH